MTGLSEDYSQLCVGWAHGLMRQHRGLQALANFVQSAMRQQTQLVHDFLSVRRVAGYVSQGLLMLPAGA